MKIKHRNRVSQDSKLKKKFILEKMNEALRDITPAENFKIVKEHLNLTALERQEKQRVEYEESKILTDERREKLNIIFADLIKEEGPKERIEIVSNMLSTFTSDLFILISKFKEYIDQICPAFYEIMNIYKMNRGKDKTPQEQDAIVLEQYLKYQPV